MWWLNLKNKQFKCFLKTSCSVTASFPHFSLYCHDHDEAFVLFSFFKKNKNNDGTWYKTGAIWNSTHANEYAIVSMFATNLLTWTNTMLVFSAAVYIRDKNNVSFIGFAQLRATITKLLSWVDYRYSRLKFMMLFSHIILCLVNSSNINYWGQFEYFSHTFLLIGNIFNFILDIIKIIQEIFDRNAIQFVVFLVWNPF